jgi:signal transduction histidine kinase/ligand-binding sensor domain-containing protein
MKVRALHIALLTLCCTIGTAQSLKYKGPDPKKAITQYTHEVWQSDNGLPQNSVEAIRQTADGFLWLATQEGLVRFDGVQFTVFDKNNTPQIRHNHIVSLTIDKKGTLWIATLAEGLVTYANGIFKTVLNTPQLSGTQTRHLYTDFHGAIWVSTRDSGVIRIDSSGVKHYSVRNGLVSNNSWEVVQDFKERIWVAGEGGVSVITNDTILTFTQKDGLAAKENYALLGSHSGDVWIGGRDGMQKFALENNKLRLMQQIKKSDGLPGSGVYEMCTDQQGNMWIANNRGLVRYYMGQLSAFTDKDGLSERLVNAVFVDREGNLWVGTDGGGLNVLKDGIFTSYTVKEGMPANNTWTIFEDRQKNIWIGTDEGLVLFEPGKGINRIYNRKDGLSHDIIWSVTQGNDGAVWAGTINGLNKIVNKKVVTLPEELKFENEAIQCVYTDSHGDLWVGTSGSGLFKISGGKRHHLGSGNGITNQFINVIIGDRSGNIVIGTDGDGLLIVRNDTVRARYTMKDGLSSNFINSLYVDSTDNIWVGSLGQGLSYFDRKTFHVFSMKNGMFDDVIYQILEDDFRRLWFSCNRGVFQVERSQFDAVINGSSSHIAYTAYGKENGMSASECNGAVAPAGAKISNGTLWFPTSRGVTTVDPKSIMINTQPPLVVVEDMIIDNEIIDKSTAAIIPPGKQRFEFRFTGLSFDGPKKVRFKVMLEGYDKEWDDIKYRRAAYYSYLPPGEYTFRVIAANSDGVWNMEGAAFPFVVQAHFYETKIFYVTVSIVLLLITYGIYRWRMRSISARQMELERLVEERTKNLTEANNAKSQLLSFVAHDLKTPLITINSIAQEIKRFEVDKHFRGYLDLVEQNSKRIVTLISEILNITAIETGKFQFKLEPINIADIAGMVVDGYQIQAQRKDQQLKYSVEGHEQCTVLADSGKMQEAMENLVSNAIKYSPRGAEITVNVVRSNGTVRFTVNDQGPGITAQEKEQLFKKFTVLSAKPTGGEIATGLGLAIVKEIIEAHKGRIFVESEPPKGSTFIIELNRFDHAPEEIAAI